MSSIFLASEANVIPIHRRIAEIMEEKGKPFTQEFVASQIGISRKTFQSVLAGDRPIYGTELFTLANIFHLTTDRLTQKDSRNCVDELHRIKDNALYRNRMLELAEWYSAHAIGRTERCDALKILGTVQFRLERYEMAHDSWSKAFTYALEILKKHGETEQFHAILQNLMLSYTVRGDYENAQKMVTRINPLLSENSSSLGFLNYTLGMIARSNQDLELARKHMYESLHHFRQTASIRQIGRSLHNVAFNEYENGNLTTATKYYEQALEALKDYPEDKMYVQKDFIKVYLKQNKLGQAYKLVQDAMKHMETIDNPVLLSKIFLLHAIIKEDRSSAEAVLQMDRIDSNQKRIACKVLLDLSQRLGDADSVLRYYEMEKSFSLNRRDLYDEEGL